MRIPTREEIRQICDQRFSPEVYEKMQAASAAIAGLGGLGSNIAVMLARTGIGKLKLIDFDRVDLSNLNRQVYDIRHLGRKKTEALAERLREINPYLALEVCDCKVTAENARGMLAEQVLLGLPQAYLIAGSGMAGWGDADQIHTRRAGKRFFICGDEETDIEDGTGLMAPRVAVCAGHQANKVVQLILQER